MQSCNTEDDDCSVSLGPLLDTPDICSITLWSVDCEEEAVEVAMGVVPPVPQ